MDKIDELQKMIDESSRIVFFSGAGVSTESGIKDFRSKDGLYNMKCDYPPEEILSHTFFVEKTSEFYKFYRDKLNCLNAEPNICHKYLKRLEEQGKLKTIVTQNIDGLHTKAGSTNVLELHGSIYRNYCMDCNRFYGPDVVFNSKDIPHCECGGIIKPDVVLYDEPLNEDIIDRTIKEISNADLLIVAGTSLTVYPASSFILYFQGKNLVIINNDPTSFDNRANLVVHDKLKNVFAKLK
jgi:NAD-dependent deacetylase